MSLFVSRRARRRYRLPDAIFEPGGRLRVATPEEARRLAHLLLKAGVGSAAGDDPAATVAAGQINALSILGDIVQVTLERLRRRDPDLLRRILLRLEERLSAERIDGALKEFAAEFGIDERRAHHGGERSADSELEVAETTLPVADPPQPDREVLLGELILFWVARLNISGGPARELIGSEADLGGTSWGRLAAEVVDLLQQESEKSAGASSLLPLLRGPALAGETAGARLAEIQALPGLVTTPELDRRVSFGLDILAEEERPRFPPGPGPLELPDFEAGEANYATDRDWMPSLVLIARNVRVWLHQLSRAHGRVIDRLDGIPESELEELARRGITGLWLIGIWERSPASQRIKRLCGNPEAGASAYAIDAYVVAEELGGEEALEQLTKLAGSHGIRLGADMVTNHTAIDSRWIFDHPNRFLTVSEAPFPGYDFEGPDLSSDPACSLHIEKRYFDRSDAAVVFRRVDRKSGETCYIYHGNDGTSVPWNDTAQLDYLNPETRQAVEDEILRVAKRFPILRFDAAMTLTRHHYQRLWHPAPGTAGAIPSRAEHGLDAEAFSRRMPEEFWRGVVDRAAVEAPETLLLAEAFWLTESFFVRTLGMHRVYNSAFMNMIREGETAMFRELLDRTLRHDPRILERQVNFLSNPDERTAIDQFGDGDRYFGACVMLATLPGLPMLGHGQIEGLHERYGMEYERAYHDEEPDPAFLARHEREIFPLLRRRRLFSGARRFRLFDALDSTRSVVDDLVIYANRGDGEHSLVMFNNSDRRVRGSIGRSRPFAPSPADRSSEPESARAELVTEELSTALGGTDEVGDYLVYRDLVSDREYIERADDLRRGGLEVELGPYGYRVLSLFRWLEDDDRGLLEQLTVELGGDGVDDLVAARLALAQEPLADEFERWVAAALGSTSEAGPEPEETGARTPADRARTFLLGLDATAPGNLDPDRAQEVYADRLKTISAWDALAASPAVGGNSPEAEARRLLGPRQEDLRAILSIWAIGETLSSAGVGGKPLDEGIWNGSERLREAVVSAWGEGPARRVLSALRIARKRRWGSADDITRGEDSVRSWLASKDVQAFVEMRTEAEGQVVSRRRLLDLIDLRLTFALLDRAAGQAPIEGVERWSNRRRRIAAVGRAEDRSGP